MPGEFRTTLKALRAELADGLREGFEERLHALATARLDINQLDQLAKLVRAYLALTPPPGPLARLRLGVIGSGTLALIEPAIAATALRHRILADVIGSDYGSAMQDALDENSPFRSNTYDLVLLALDHRTLGLDQPRLAAAEAEAAVASAFDLLQAMVAGLDTVASGGVMVASVVPPSNRCSAASTRSKAAALRRW